MAKRKKRNRTESEGLTLKGAYWDADGEKHTCEVRLELVPEGPGAWSILWTEVATGKRLMKIDQAGGLTLPGKVAASRLSNAEVVDDGREMYRFEDFAAKKDLVNVAEQVRKLREEVGVLLADKRVPEEPVVITEDVDLSSKVHALEGLVKELRNTVGELQSESFVEREERRTRRRAT